jgi:uncharacterized protein (PEP-CTERM system associated)
LPEQLLIGRVGTIYDLFFARLEADFPDPVVRDREVLLLLTRLGIPRDVALSAEFLSSRVLLNRSLNASVSVLGVRNTVTLLASQQDSRTVERQVFAFDDFSSLSEIEQRSVSGSWTHQLSRLSSVTGALTHIRSIGTGVTSVESKQSAAHVFLTRKFGAKTSGTLGARYVRFEGEAGSDFREKAINASLSVTF